MNGSLRVNKNLSFTIRNLTRITFYYHYIREMMNLVPDFRTIAMDLKVNSKKHLFKSQMIYPGSDTEN